MKVAIPWKDYTEQIPLDYLVDNEDIYGKLIPSSIQNPVTNLPHEFLFFQASEKFSPAATAYLKSEEERAGSGIEPKYCPYLKGTIPYRKFWTEERRRCLQGYSVDDVWITGEHYFYLNYCQIGRVAINKDTGEETEEIKFPMFCSMDYYWFLELERAQNPKKGDTKGHIIAAKSRRMGFSYKNASGALWRFSFFKESKTVIASEFGAKAKNTFDMAMTMLDFLNKSTEFGTPTVNKRSTDNKCYVKAGAEVSRKGKKYIKGMRSIIETVTLHSKPDAAAGLGATRIIFEEAGLIKDLKKAWRFTEPTLRSGSIYKGIGIIYGTGGDMDGATQDFSDMFYNPEAYELRAYDNVWEKETSAGKCGFFIDAMWFMEGGKVNINGKHYRSLDDNGNAIRWVGEILVNRRRAGAKKGSREDFNTFITQLCKTPSEAFLVVEGNVFPVEDLFERLSYLKSNNYFRLFGTRGYLAEHKDKVNFRPDLEGKLEAIDTYPMKPGQKDREGSLIIYEEPVEEYGVIPAGLYIASIDPIGIDSDGGESLIAIYVVKTKKFPHLGHDEVVASYVGRPKYDPVETTNDLLLKIAKYYNAKVTHENDRNGAIVREYFIKNKAYKYLLKPPASVVEKHITDSKTLMRKTGHSMSSDSMKEIGEIYTKKWLLERRGFNDETGTYDRNLDLIVDKGLLEELIHYRRDINCDRVSALMGVVLQMRHMQNEYIKQEENAITVASFFKKQSRHLVSSNPRTYEQISK
jgi:hypothetical protein